MKASGMVVKSGGEKVGGSETIEVLDVRDILGPMKRVVRENDPGYDVPSEVSICSRRSSTVQWAGSGWEGVPLAVGMMLKEPASAPCERLSMRRPI